eukprot:g33714.t1
MIISNKRESNQHPLTIKNITIAEFPTINILRVTIDQKLNLASHINAVAGRVCQSLGILQQVCLVLFLPLVSLLEKRYTSTGGGAEEIHS